MRIAQASRRVRGRVVLHFARTDRRDTIAGGAANGWKVGEYPIADASKIKDKGVSAHFIGPLIAD